VKTECPVIVTVSDTCRKTISHDAAAAADGRETGGILLGHHHARPQPTLDVVHAGDAGPGAVRQAATFRRDVPYAQALADLAYRIDGSIWIGEWHTHHGGPPRPSHRDVTSYRRVLRDPELAFQVFLTVIVVPGPADGWNQPRLADWVVSITETWTVVLLRRAHQERTSQ
jgi:integrative and conjugative element protein (TIGR02256 family)